MNRSAVLTVGSRIGSEDTHRLVIKAEDIYLGTTTVFRRYWVGCRKCWDIEGAIGVTPQYSVF
jgi:hypothetical protein